jgi:hypothetical protein
LLLLKNGPITGSAAVKLAIFTAKLAEELSVDLSKQASI